jgi:hypothetical protein
MAALKTKGLDVKTNVRRPSHLASPAADARCSRSASPSTARATCSLLVPHALRPTLNTASLPCLLPSLTSPATPTC